MPPFSFDTNQSGMAMKKLNFLWTIFLLVMFVSLGNLQAQTTYVIQTYSDGAKYVGEFKNGKQHGHGTYTYLYGDKYVGEFSNGKRHGKGTMTYSSGMKYIGAWKDGREHGQGTKTYSDGDEVNGIWKMENQ